MDKQDAKTLARLRREEMPVYAGRGAGFHRDKSKYKRHSKHKGKGYDA